MELMAADGVVIVLDGFGDVGASRAEELKLFDDFVHVLLEVDVAKSSSLAR